MLVKHNNNSISDITSVNLEQGKMTLISSQTASSSASIETNFYDIDPSYDIYYWNFINIHPSLDEQTFQFQVSIDGGSTYGNTITSTAFRSLHNETNTYGNVEYRTAKDLAQSTSFQPLTDFPGNDNDQSFNGELYLFAPQSGTYVKHFICTTQSNTRDNFSDQYFVAGYVNTTSTVESLKFQFSSGNIDSGTIKLYGIGE
jgi:hypothetical protein